MAVKFIRSLDLKSRFFYYVEKTDGCWIWTGSKYRGYGRFRFKYKKHFAHRVSYEIHCGIIPPEMFVCHHCDNPSCVNPEHLFIGTAGDNNRDSALKGRAFFQHYIGSKNHQTKLTISQVTEIKKLLGTKTQRSIALEFGISPTVISEIANNKIWRHVK